MDNFIVSARKYRPTSFDTVVGQEHITHTLINEIKNNKLAQAFLFNGPRGVGKTTCARILAKEINKESIKDKNYDYSYNIFELDAASNNSVDDIRLLNEQVRIPPQVGSHKVYIIDEVHMLSAAAFNAFLKTLEEPPPYAIFILATTERHKILPTILSRCQVFTFNRITVKDIVHHLNGIADAEGIQVDEEALHVIAQKADGALRDALSIFDQMISIAGGQVLKYVDVVKHLNVLDYDYYFKLTDAFAAQDVGQTLLIFNEILSHGFDGQLFLNGLASHFRDLMVGRSPETLALLEVPPHVYNKYVEAAKTFDQGFLVNSINIINSYDLSYKGSRNQRLHVELALIKLCYLPSLVSGEKKKLDIDLSAPPKGGLPSLSGQPTNTVSETVPEVAEKAVVSTTEEIVQPVEEKVAPLEKAKPTPRRVKKTSERVVKLGRLDDLLDESPEATTPEPEVVQATETEAEIRVTEISLERLEQVFNQFQEKVREESRALIVALFTVIKPQLEGNKVIIHLIKQHKIQLEEIKVEFLQFLRDGLGRKDIQLELIETKKKVKGKRAYTGQEKFDEMAKKNPALLKLREKLNLTIK